MTAARKPSLILALVCFAIAFAFGAALLSGGTVTAPRVLQSVVTDGGGWKIELADYAEPTHFELWSTRLSPPGPRIRISQQTTGQGWDVSTGFVVIQSDRTWRAVYELDQIAQGIHDLYAVDVDGGRRERVDNLVAPVYVRFGTEKVTFGSEVVAGGQVQWWITTTQPSAQLVPVIFADGFENGGRARWQ